jgi:glycosyltransferase involved in cell wall biosynthesis
LKVLVDASAAFNQGAGIGRYARNLLGAVQQELSEADFALWYAPERGGPAPFARELLERFEAPPEVIRARFSRRRADQLLFRAKVPIPFQALAGRGDVAYSPDFTIPRAPGIPNVVTIHDLAYEVRPDFAPEALRTYLQRVVPRQIERADRVVAVSETTRRDLEERMGVDPYKIVVVANGVDQTYFEAGPLETRYREALGLPDDYLLIVGTIEPRKNHLGLFSALDELGPASSLPLVIAGRVGWSADPILAASAPLQVRNRVILLDYVPEAMLPGLIAGAAALVYPSWYEGFGRPLLEAMAAGTPVVASDVPAHREVAGDVADYCDPASSASIAAAIEAALRTDRQTSEARAARRARAKEFSWVSSGKNLTALLRELTKTTTSPRSRNGSRR